MSADLPAFWFPPSGPALPPLPESTLEPKPPEDDPRWYGTIESVGDLHWYMHNLLRNEENYMNGEFSWKETNIHAGDVIVPIPRYPDYFAHDIEKNVGVSAWEMWCFRCPSTVDPEEPERDPITGFPFCGRSILSMEPLTYHSYQSASQAVSPDLEVPYSTVPGADSVMACVIEQQIVPQFYREKFPEAHLAKIITKPFIVSSSPRNSNPNTRYRYNETYPQGVFDFEFQQAMSSSSSYSYYQPDPTPPPSSTTDFWDWYDDYTPTSVSNPAAFKTNSTRDSPSAGIIIGIIVPIALAIGIIACIGKRSRDKQLRATASSAPPMNTNPQADARRQAALAARVSPTAAVPATEQADEDDMLPPAYHKVVSNVERMDIERRMHAERTAPAGWPPTYTDAQHAELTTVTQPDPVASVPGRSQAPYPALPSSPAR
ncbi:hypothetical protein COCC4DRAFT_129935 [Bipolaris maydis ATCC 48331]|uniref:Uncharacterized protein n=2 Tax=Cochliobolus heterostrophus TaxID=5016 RepID=M2UF85_COCH5|nr:uncharacterized protein COCC4DRAFT_129935 [Bipolaris maydis ATCC 48331]EMD92341.1 hypothetical protein COCHEDRAFT_1099282 [Bipolaris maydis C5]KAJ5022181.1 hypothetical protein J3E73DRAFT_17396 [Bipolaris maydis]ENI08032.1 hypothetical protein COCC4DRAFT_129935 [Bipolaris maydis ATCC 48331]KAJ5060870.1 hypothetical protein J3E74DRAFT_289730 [Bipolaris maydis]KAJ6198006.1 hypothetical protein J3E72DRAFT_39968 [Bipolaris maydis]